MLISPAKIHASLSALLSSTPVSGPHTALLITPQGQLISAASIPADEDEESGEGGEGEEGDGVVGTGGVIAEEPYLDPPARLRLLLGLASQWNQGESPKMECEVKIGFPPFQMFNLTPISSLVDYTSLLSLYQQPMPHRLLSLKITSYRK